MTFKRNGERARVTTTQEAWAPGVKGGRSAQTDNTPDWRAAHTQTSVLSDTLLRILSTCSGVSQAHKITRRRWTGNGGSVGHVTVKSQWSSARPPASVLATEKRTLRTKYVCISTMYFLLCITITNSHCPQLSRQKEQSSPPAVSNTHAFYPRRGASFTISALFLGRKVGNNYILARSFPQILGFVRCLRCLRSVIISQAPFPTNPRVSALFWWQTGNNTTALGELGETRLDAASH